MAGTVATTSPPGRWRSGQRVSEPSILGPTAWWGCPFRPVAPLSSGSKSRQSGHALSSTLSNLFLVWAAGILVVSYTLALGIYRRSPPVPAASRTALDVQLAEPRSAKGARCPSRPEAHADVRLTARPRGWSVADWYGYARVGGGRICVPARRSC
jgi:hypothetical protein